MGDLRTAIKKSRGKHGPSEDFNLNALMEAIAREIVDERMQNVQEEIEKRIKTFFDDLVKNTNRTINETVTKSIEKRIADDLKGDPGEKGDDGDTPVIDLEAIALRAARLVTPPDTKKIAKMAAALIKPPAVDHEKIAARAANLIEFPDLEAFGEQLKGEIAEANGEKESGTIDIDDIKGLKSLLDNINRSVREAGRGKMIHGGGMTIKAGSGQTITRNTDGTWTLTTGGLTVLSATETPNGNRTVFTFSAATAQPSYIRSDNALMKAVSASGTVNWTWNNTTKKATMTIAPQDDIEAIV